MSVTTFFSFRSKKYRVVVLFYVQGYYMTMDTGKLDENGYIHIGGRIDDIINVAGHRLSTKQMEMVCITLM